MGKTCSLLLDLDVNAFEGGEGTEAVEGFGIGGGGDDEVLVVDLTLETIATLVYIVVLKISFFEQGWTAGGALAFGYVAGGIADFECHLVLACSAEGYVAAHVIVVAGMPLLVAVALANLRWVGTLIYGVIEPIGGIALAMIIIV